MMSARIARDFAGRRSLVGALFLAFVGALLVSVPPPPAEAACTGNAIVCENELSGTPASEWDISGAGDDSIQGFATSISVNAGSPIQFKIDTDASAYAIKIYRLGYYQGNGARLITTVNPSASLPQNQPNCATDPDTAIYDCGTWAVSATWNVPAAAVSGVYFAHLIRSDNQQSSHIPFIVRNDGNTSKVLFQTSDTTWQAYNTYGGASYYAGGGAGRAFKLSYNRPWKTRAWQNGRDFLFSNEYPMIRFLEQNGYDVSYVSGLDTHLDANLITRHKAFLSVGHDEYWSKEQRDHVLAARDAGTNLAFFSGNEVYWKTRWEASQDGTSTPNRTLVCYKDTWANQQIDPVTPTATWRDPRFGDLGHGPENSLTGTLYKSNLTDLAIKVDSTEGKLRLWRNTPLESLAGGSTATLAAHTIGYESNEDLDNGFRPAGLTRLSSTTGPTPEYLTDFGNTVVPGTTTHHLTQYRAASGALVFSAGTIQWAWGLDSNHDGNGEAADPRIRQATVNILADMDAPATTIASGLVASTKSTDTTGPTATITSPASGASLTQGSLVTVTGTASDTGGGRVAGVEVSLDNGARWHPADGRASFSYSGILTGNGPGAIQVRATDDSGNIQSQPTTLTVNAPCPCTIFGALQPVTAAAADNDAVTLGTRFTTESDGFVSGIRFYKGTGNTGTHTGTLYSSTGTALSTATFANETSSGWQTVTFSNAVPVTAGSTYVAAYYAPNGRYAADAYFFSYRGHTAGQLSALGGNGSANVNGVFRAGNGFPNESFRQTNYYVDVVYNSTDDTPLSVTTVTPLGDSTSVLTTANITATFNRPVTPSSITFTVLDPGNTPVPGTVSYDAATRRATFNPTQPLGTATRYTATVNATSTTGMGLAAPYQWAFTTVQPASTPGVCPCTLFDETDQPTDPSVSDPDNVQLGTAFRSSTPGMISGIRFFKGAQNTGTHTITLWSGSGSELATATVTGESTAGWQQASFASPVSISANTTYIASYRAPNGRYANTVGGLASALSKGPLSSLANGGRYQYGNGAPLNTSSSNYYVDPVFSPVAGQAPTVVSISPGNGATSVPVSARITAVFNGDVQPGTAQMSLKRTSDGSTVAGSVANETPGNSATFAPAATLDPGTQYTVTVSGAQSLSGTPMTAPYTASFTTSGATACPCSLLETTAEPVVSDSGDGAAVTLGLRFKATVDGEIKGLRYYRDASNTGTHTGTLWTVGGQSLATLTFTNSGVGWQTATFSSPVEITAGTTYVASYYAPQGHYSAAVGYFDAPVTNTPLASVAPGGVYLYGNGFPTQSYLNSHYYVDVVFTTTNNDPPTVTATTPADQATSVTAGTTVTATFSRAITPASLVFRLTDPQSQLVPGQVSYDATTRRATFTPAAPLADGTRYTASVEAASASGVAMTAPKTWSFTVADTNPPTVSAVSPTDGATNVAASVSPTARFAADVTPGSVLMTLRTAAGATVNGSSSYDAATRTVTYAPAAALANYTQYRASVTAQNTSGVPMPSPKVWTFTTADTIAPTVSSISPGNNATGVSANATVSATFARAIDPASLQMSLRTPAGTAVSGTTNYVAATRVATFTPSSPLANFTRYTATVSATNPSGVAMATPRTWSFTTADTLPPEVTSTTPADDATNVAANVRPTATFARPITTSSLVFTLTGPGGNTVAGTTSYNATTRAATFIPSAALTSSTRYTASVRARSAPGIDMAAPKTWSFTTAAQTFSLYATSARPQTSAVPSPAPTTVGVEFSSTRSGAVTAIRYYASSVNTGNTVRLWSEAGEQLGTATTAQTGTGWRTATFATPVSITAGITYVASYYAPVGRHAQTTAGYASAYTAGPLTVPASGGRTAVGNSFPTVRTPHNFWVDVLVRI